MNGYNIDTDVFLTLQMTSGDLETGVVTVTVGLLEIQGAFLEHRVALQKAARSLSRPIDLHLVEVRTAEQLRPEMDALIIPGGESTTISIYFKRNNMETPLRQWVQNPDHVTWGTCAGMILLAKLTENQKLGGQSSVSRILLLTTVRYLIRIHVLTYLMGDKCITKLIRDHAIISHNNISLIQSRVHCQLFPVNTCFVHINPKRNIGQA